jgi:Arc/MetJ family transcription regulator
MQHDETNQFDITLIREQQILRLQISIDDAFAVQVLECLDHACHAESSGDVIKVTSRKGAHIEQRQ